MVTNPKHKIVPGTLYEIYINSMVVDALDPCVTRSLAAVVLNMWVNKQMIICINDFIYIVQGNDIEYKDIDMIL